MGSVILYISIFLISTFMLSKSKKGKNFDIFFLIAIILPVIFAALRENVGTDYITYTYMYQKNANLCFVEWFKLNRDFDGDRLIIWLMAQVSKLFNSKELFFAFFASFTVIPVAWRLKTDYDKSIRALSYFVYLATLYIGGLNTCKQAAAIGILFFGLKYVHERKIKKYIIVVLFASLIHVTALFAIFIYFLYDYKKSFFTIKKVTFIILGIVILSLIPRMANLVGGRFDSYLVYDGEISNLSFFIILFWTLVFCVLFKYYTSFDNRNGTLIVMMIIGLILSLTGFHSPFIKRIALYFTFPQFLLMGQLPNMFLEGKNRFFVKLAVYSYTIVLFIVQFYILGHGNIFPYKMVGVGL